MATARLPRQCTIDMLAKQLGEAGAFDGDSEPLYFSFRKKLLCILHRECLTGWCYGY
jgi:hypothetical protein